MFNNFCRVIIFALWIARQMAREERDVISMCCMKNDVGNLVSDADGMNKKLLNIENEWEVGCPAFIGIRCQVSMDDIRFVLKPDRGTTWLFSS